MEIVTPAVDFGSFGGRNPGWLMEGRPSGWTIILPISKRGSYLANAIDVGVIMITGMFFFVKW